MPTRFIAFASSASYSSTFRQRMLSQRINGLLLVTVLMAANPVRAQYAWQNFAGKPGGPGHADGVGTEAQFDAPFGIAIDPNGNRYITNRHTIRKMTPDGRVTTIAGLAGSPGTVDGPASVARFASPAGVAVDTAGNLYVTDRGSHTLRKITPAGIVSTLAGFAGVEGSSDGTGPAARFKTPLGVAVDAAGTVYVADSGNDTIRKVTPEGVVSTLAGTAGNNGTSDGTGPAAQFVGPYALAIGGSGMIYVTDGYRIRKISGTGEVSTLAGGTTSGFLDGVGPGARFAFLRGVAIDEMENLFVLDASSNSRIRKVSSTGEVTTVVRWQMEVTFSRTLGGIGIDPMGNMDIVDTDWHSIKRINAELEVTHLAGHAGTAGGRDGTGTKALFSSPMGAALDPAGNLYVADTENHLIRIIDPTGNVVTLAGAAGVAGSENGVANQARFNGPKGVALDDAGNVYVSDTGNHTIRKITRAGVVTTLAGSPGDSGSANGSSTTARFNAPTGIVVNGSSAILVSDTGNHTIRSVSTSNGTVSLLAGSAGLTGSVDGSGAAARFSRPEGLVRGASGVLYVADRDNHTIRRVTTVGVVTTFAGSAGNGASVDGIGTAARFFHPSAITWDLVGNLYVADAGTGRLRQVSTTAEVTTLGNSEGPVVSGASMGLAAVPRNVFPAAPYPGLKLYLVESDTHRVRVVYAPGSVRLLAGSPDSRGSTDAIGPLARFSSPESLVIDQGGTMYVADTASHTIRKMSNDGLVTTLAGAAGIAGNADGSGPAARLSSPRGVAVASDGTLYVADTDNHTIRKLTGTGVVSTFAGLAGVGGTADGSAATARFRAPRGVAVDDSMAVFVADTGNHTIRRISSAGVVSTFSGQGGTSGSIDGTAGEARFRSPHGLAIDSNGNIYVADTGNHTIRRLTPDGAVTTVAGQAGSAGAVDGPGGEARFRSPRGLALDSTGTLFVVDSDNHTIRKVGSDGMVTTIGGAPGLVGSSDGFGTAAGFSSPTGIAVSAQGNVFVVDTANNRFVRGAPAGTPDTPPPVSLLPPVEIGVLTASLSGAVNPNGAATTVRFEYGTAPTCDQISEVTLMPNDNTETHLIQTTLIGLSPDTVYYYRLAAANIHGPARTTTSSFRTTTKPPMIEVAAASEVRATTATVSGTVNPNGAATTAYIEYGLTTAYENNASIELSPNDNTATQTVSIALIGLEPSRVYHYRLVAKNMNGTATTSSRTFSTLALPVRLSEMTNRGSETAVLEGFVNSNGADTNVRFEYGLTTEYGSVATVNEAVVGQNAFVSTLIRDIQPDTVYHYRLVATSSLGTFPSESRSFKTLSTYPAYSIKELGTLGGASSFAYGINNAGQVVGASFGGGRYHAFVNTDGLMKDLGSFDDSQSHGYGINLSGEVTGRSRISLGVSHAYRYTNNVMMDLGTLGGNQSAAFGINDAGQVTGASSLNDNARSEAFLFSDGIMTGLGTLGGGASIGRSINSQGQIAGMSQVQGDTRSRAFLYSAGTISDLGTLGGDNSYGLGINDKSSVVGIADLPGYTGSRAFVYESSSMNELSSLAHVGSHRHAYAATSINNYGQIVGILDNQTAFVFIDGGIYDLSLLVGQHARLRIQLVAEEYAAFGPSNHPDCGRSINDWGQIAAIISQRAILLNPEQPFSRLHLSESVSRRETKFVGGMHYDKFTPTTQEAGRRSQAALLGGTVGSGGRGAFGLNRDVMVSVRADELRGLASDAVELAGIDSDTLVLRVSYDEAAAIGQFGSEAGAVLGWLDGGVWRSAVTGNNGGVTAFAGDGAYDQSTDFQLGTYGVDTAANTVWAVINHEGTFGVIGGSAPPAGAYEIWAASFGVATTPDAIRDTDGDGVVDLLEFAFNLDPKSPRFPLLPAEGGSSGLPWVGLSGAGDNRRLRVSFLRRAGELAAGLSYEAEFSASLAGPWESPAAPLAISPVDASWERVVAEDPVSALGSPLRFGRVRVRIAR